MAVIIVEGADCSGKDSLIKELKRITGYSVVRGSSFELSKNGSESMRDVMLDNFNKEGVIFNRSYLSNLVYAPLFDYPMIKREHALEVTKKINETDDKSVIVVYLHADRKTLEERMEKRGDDDVSSSDLKSILNMYISVIMSEFSPKNLLSFDTSRYDSRTIAKKVLSYLSEPSY